MEFILPADLLQNVKSALALLKADLYRLQQPAVLRHQLPLFLAAKLHVLQNRCTGNGDGAVIARLGLRRSAPGQQRSRQHQRQHRPDGGLFICFPDVHAIQLHMCCIISSISENR